MLVNSLEDMKRALPGTSWVSLYTTLYKTFVTQLDQLLNDDLAPSSQSFIIKGWIGGCQLLNDDLAPSNPTFDDKALTGWWDPVDGGLLDLSNWLDAEASGLDGSG